MSFTVQNMKDRIQMWAQAHVPPERHRDFNNSEFVSILNTVAEDFNSEGSIRMERYYRKTTEDETNYELQGDIIRVYKLNYEADGYKDQVWTFIDDTIVFETAPDGDVQLDIEYLREVELVVDDTDEIDLPNNMLHDYFELVKKKMLVDYAGQDETYYQQALSIAVSKSNKKNYSQPTGGIRRAWFTDAKGDFLYDITEQYVGQENIAIAALTGKYYFL